MDAAVDDSDVKLLKVSGGLFDNYFARLPAVLYDGNGAMRNAYNMKDIERLVGLLEPFQESPQLLDPHLSQFLAPLTTSLTTFISRSPPETKPPPPGFYTLPVAIARLLYTLVKIRGPKIICRFLPNQPLLLESVASLFSDPSTGIDDSWELRYILLLWLGHLLLAPFDLSTISTDPSTDVVRDLLVLDGTGLDVAGLPYLSKQLLALGISYLSSSGNRESGAAAQLLIRISLRRDMRSLGLLDAMVEWGTKLMVATVDAAGTSRSLFLKTGVLDVLAGFLAQGDSEGVQKFVPQIFELVTGLQDDGDCDEWMSAGMRRLGMKIYRWVATLTLAQPRKGDYIEDIIERLLNGLGDRDTAVRFGASKSLAVVARKLDPGMAGDVLEAVMSVYEEDVFFDPPVAQPGQKRKKMLTAVTPGRWHGATLTLATFLRQRAVRSTDVMTRVVECIVQALSFEQRRSTFAVGGNVRDAACYAAWSLARSYTTDELQGAGDIVVATTGFEEGRKIIQLLATELVVAGCTDSLGNVRRAASAALQELVGRHSGCVKDGISLVQAVDYNAVALRQRSVVTVAHNAAVLCEEYWKGIVFGLVEGWRGIGSHDDGGRKLAAASLGKMVAVTYSTDNKISIRERGKFVFRIVMDRTKTEGMQHIEVYHGCLRALAEILDGLYPLNQPDAAILDDEDRNALHGEVFSKLQGNELTNPVMRPEISTEAASRLVRSLTTHTPSLLDPRISSWRLWTAIVEVSLDRLEDSVLDEAVPAAKALINKLSSANKHSLTNSWRDKIANSSYRHRGHILALGEVLAGISDTTVNLEYVLDTLVSAALRPGVVEIRLAGVRALGRGTEFSPKIVETILESLSDYATDTRGDIGSWVRSEAITAVVSHWKQGHLTDVPSNIKWAVLSKLVRLSVEKLDRLRTQAGEAILTISPSFPDLARLVPVDTQFLLGSTQEYFSYLLPLLSLPQLRESFLEGYITSAGAGSDSVVKASRRALLHYLSTATATTTFSSIDIAPSLLTVLQRAIAATDDRIVMPFLDVSSLLIDTGMLPLPPAIGRRLFVLTQKAHFRSTNVAKLTAAVRVYRSLALSEAEYLRQEVVTKLVGMLMHPFTRVRMDVSDAVYVIAAEGSMRAAIAEGMAAVDWSRGTKEVAADVKIVKKGLIG